MFSLQKLYKIVMCRLQKMYKIVMCRLQNWGVKYLLGTSGKKFFFVKNKSYLCRKI